MFAELGLSGLGGVSYWGLDTGLCRDFWVGSGLWPEGCRVLSPLAPLVASMGFWAFSVSFGVGV